MKSFADLLETVTAASATDAERNLVTAEAVKTALRISNADSDTLIAGLIPRVTQLVVDHCRLARDAAGGQPTFARETLRATWHAGCERRGYDLYLPWRPAVSSIDSVVENGTTLTAGTDYVSAGGRSGRLRRLNGDRPCHWQSGKIVVIFKAGFASVLSSNVDKALEAAVIEQLRGWTLGANRDPTIRSVNSPDIGAESYSVPGGDVMGGFVLYPQVRDMLAAWRDPRP